ncbi:2-dehydro-3-deoxyphosphogluconate aldolase / (4S)-4-hydroxy-2-oxoglutarate aldolase [Lentzea fradiae]|uniref:2-dehydro-3-deoxyphosphogluconate aldolase / (4S)-4-hydroxy-2-oxoglutarate aldolase n=1 Tax=Lentzea fradiae TaxID=200378 RepID=A0A1G7NTC4_9PSEU|nr:hypothetical protein [Lentzea fradiae]SDF77282.1 2-dehydro-3-deoxyphosphogluconate aldolase / (4S)-4-hydroxy-2-oxoglutarate aldolase [Lentzea fradiae]
MSFRYEITGAVVRQGVIGIIRTADAASALRASVPLLDAGLRALELPPPTPAHSTRSGS